MQVPKSYLLISENWKMKLEKEWQVQETCRITIEIYNKIMFPGRVQTWISANTKL